MWIVLVVHVFGEFVLTNVFSTPANCTESEAKEFAANFAGSAEHIIILSQDDWNSAGQDTVSIVEKHLAECETVPLPDMNVPDLGIKMPLPGTDFSFN